MINRSPVVLLIFISWLFSLNISPVFACSGGAPLTVQGLLSFADYAVQATVTESDDLGQNVVIRVENYLSGGPGPEYLLLKRDDPLFYAYLLSGRSSGGDCIGLYPEFSPGDEFYAFVKRDVDGSYQLIRTLFNAPFYSFETDEITVEVFLEGSYQNGEQILEHSAKRGTGQDVTEAEFIEIIAQVSGERATSPAINSPYPLYAPLWIFTDADPITPYMLPVDFGEIVHESSETLSIANHPMRHFGFSEAGSCSAEGCAQISPDNLSIAVQVDADKIQFAWGESVEGQAALFSATSDTVAVWNNCDLNIYTTGYPRLYQGWFEIVGLNSVALNSAVDCNALHQNGVWSPDGRFLAFSDTQGLWLWDVYSVDISPRILIESIDGNMPIARYFSPLGRYIAVSVADTHFTLDIVTDERLPDGIISPDDRLLLSFDTSMIPSSLEICSLTPFSCQLALGMYIEIFDENGERESLRGPEAVTQVLWTGDTIFIARACVPDDPDICAIFKWGPPGSFGGWEAPNVLGSGYNFDYDAANRQIAIVNDASTITIEGHSVDLASHIEGSIQKVQWMPSLFYRD